MVGLHGEVTNFSDPNVAVDYCLESHTQDLAAMSSSPSVRAAGDVLLSGKLHYRSKKNQPLLRSVAIDGQIGSEALSAVSSGRRLDLRKLRGKYQLANGSLRANGVEAELLGGRVSNDICVQNVDSTPNAKVRATLHNISLQAAQPAIHRPELNRLAVSGTLDGTA